MDAQIEERQRHRGITAGREPVHETCCGCIELYHGCNAQPEGKSFKCGDYRRLPDVMPGVPLPPFPPSRMGGRTEPRAREASASAHGERSAPRIPRPRTPPTKTAAVQPQEPRTQSPTAGRGPDGERLCGCGASLPRRKRCCDACRLKRRENTIHQHRSRKRSPAAVDAGSSVPATPAPRPATHARSPAHSYLGLRGPEQPSV